MGRKTGFVVYRKRHTLPDGTSEVIERRYPKSEAKFLKDGLKYYRRNLRTEYADQKFTDPGVRVKETVTMKPGEAGAEISTCERIGSYAQVRVPASPKAPTPARPVAEPAVKPRQRLW